MSIDYIPIRPERRLPPLISGAATLPCHDRIQAVIEAERIHDMLTTAAYDMDRAVPDEKLAFAERIWFGDERPFSSARKAWQHLEDELERWETRLEAERSALALSILDLEVGDIVIAGTNERPLRISVTGATLYVGNGVTFTVYGTRLRKDGFVGKFAIPSRSTSRATRRARRNDAHLATGIKRNW